MFIKVTTEYIQEGFPREGGENSTENCLNIGEF